MKKEHIRRPDGRYLIYYSFDPSETTPLASRKPPKPAKRRAAARRRGR
jgi:hypothetical protein